MHDFVAEAAAAQAYGLDKIPATVIAGAAKGYFGIPSGYEFDALVESIVDVAQGQTNLTPATKTELAKVNKPVHIQVFVTPT